MPLHSVQRLIVGLGRQLRGGCKGLRLVAGCASKTTWALTAVVRSTAPASGRDMQRVARAVYWVVYVLGQERCPRMLCAGAGGGKRAQAAPSGGGICGPIRYEHPANLV